METVFWNSLQVSVVLHYALNLEPKTIPVVSSNKSPKGQGGFSSEKGRLLLRSKAQVGWSLAYFSCGLFRVDSVVLVGVLLVSSGLFLLARKFTASNDSVTTYSPSWRLLFALTAGTVTGASFNYTKFGEFFGNPRLHKEIFTYYIRSVMDAVLLTGYSVIVPFGISLVSFLVTLGLAIMTIMKSGRGLRFPVVARAWHAYITMFMMAAYVLVMPHSDYLRYELVILFALHALVVVNLSLIWYLKGTLAKSPRSSSSKFTFAAGMAFVLLGSFGSFQLSRGIIEDSQSSWYVQAARLNAGEWLSGVVGPADVVLSSDLGALSWKLSGIEFLDINGLTSESVVRAVLAGHAPQAGLKSHPTVLVDTGDENGRTVAEEIWDRPNEYFAVGNLVPRCSFAEAYDKKFLGRWPKIGDFDLYIWAFELIPSETTC